MKAEPRNYTLSHHEWNVWTYPDKEGEGNLGQKSHEQKYNGIRGFVIRDLKTWGSMYIGETI